MNWSKELKKSINKVAMWTQQTVVFDSYAQSGVEFHVEYLSTNDLVHTSPNSQNVEERSFFYGCEKKTIENYIKTL